MHTWLATGAPTKNLGRRVRFGNKVHCSVECESPLVFTICKCITSSSSDVVVFAGEVRSAWRTSFSHCLYPIWLASIEFFGRRRPCSLCFVWNCRGNANMGRFIVFTSLWKFFILIAPLAHVIYNHPNERQIKMKYILGKKNAMTPAACLWLFNLYLLRRLSTNAKKIESTWGHFSALFKIFRSNEPIFRSFMLQWSLYQFWTSNERRRVTGRNLGRIALTAVGRACFTVQRFCRRIVLFSKCKGSIDVQCETTSYRDWNLNGSPIYEAIARNDDVWSPNAFLTNVVRPLLTCTHWWSHRLTFRQINHSVCVVSVFLFYEFLMFRIRRLNKNVRCIQIFVTRILFCFLIYISIVRVNFAHVLM